jgi:hypothetical protein
MRFSKNSILRKKPLTLLVAMVTRINPKFPTHPPIRHKLCSKDVGHQVLKNRRPSRPSIPMNKRGKIVLPLIQNNSTRCAASQPLSLGIHSILEPHAPIPIARYTLPNCTTPFPNIRHLIPFKGACHCHNSPPCWPSSPLPAPVGRRQSATSHCAIATLFQRAKSRTQK